jgi:hypothetical protein
MLDSPNPNDRLLAAQGFVDLLTKETDRIARWGTVFLLLHLPYKRYLNLILDVLQDNDQPKEIQSAAKILSTSKWLKSRYTHASLLITTVRVRNLLYLTAKLYPASVLIDD